MKIDRLLSIITILLQKDKVTAPYLAEKFEVSRRTINRDIETLCMAGFPIITTQGVNGGISIIDGFKLEKQLLASDDLSNIITALKGLSTVSDSPKIEMLLDKFKPSEKSETKLDNNIIIDLASNYKESVSKKISILKESINNVSVKFLYCSKNGESYREVDPYKIVYKWDFWYLLAFCQIRDDFRMFKLNRLWELQKTNKKFNIRKIPESVLNFGRYFTDTNFFKVIFDKSVKYKVIESYGPDSFSEKNGKLYFEGNYTDEDFIISWLFGFGNKAKVTSPASLINKMKSSVMKF